MRFDVPWAAEINRMQNEMDRLFGRRAISSFTPSRAYPPVNVWEDDDNLYVETEMPGMGLDQFELIVNNDDHLTLQGERNQPGSDESNGNLTRHRNERAFGRFSRIIQLPASVDADAAGADYQAGVLRITLPKKPEAKPKRISVETA